MTQLRYSYEKPNRIQPPAKKRVGLWIVVFVLILAAAFPVWRHFNARPDAEVAVQSETAQNTQNTPTAENDATLSAEELPAADSPAEVLPLPSPTPAIPAELAEEISKLTDLVNQHEFVQARKLAESLLPAEEDHPAWEKIATQLSRANAGIFFTDIPFPERKETYIVTAGDALDPIARKFNTTVEAIQIANRLNRESSNIRIGQKFRIYKGEWSIRVSKEKTKLYLYDQDKLFMIYNIGVGKQDRTPTGTFQISAKVKNPPWYAPDGRVIEFGQPENILGTRWLNLEPVGETDKNLTGYGIHGTWEESRPITDPLSNGCVRMRNSDVEELFDILPHRVPVTIE